MSSTVGMVKRWDAVCTIVELSINQILHCWGESENIILQQYSCK